MTIIELISYIIAYMVIGNTITINMTIIIEVRNFNLAVIRIYGNIVSNRCIVSTGAEPRSSCNPLKGSLRSFQLQTDATLSIRLLLLWLMSCLLVE